MKNLNDFLKKHGLEENEIIKVNFIKEMFHSKEVVIHPDGLKYETRMLHEIDFNK